MSLFTFTLAPIAFVPQVARRVLRELNPLPALRDCGEFCARVEPVDEDDAPCGALVLVEEDVERWDGLS